MANISKDARKVNKAQKLYDESVDQYLDIIESLNSQIPEIYDILQGIAMGRTEDKYQVTSSRHAALKDQFNFWKENIKNPDKILANIDNELKNKFNAQSKDSKKSKIGEDDSRPKVVQFSSSAT